MKRVFRRPSPAMVIAIVALVAALGGTAIGAAFVTKKQAKKIAKNQVNKLAPGLSVNHAKTADNANTLGGNPPSAFEVVARSGAPDSCDPGSTTFVNCSTLDLTLAHSSRLMLQYDAPYHRDSGTAVGVCRLVLDGTTVGDSTSPPIGTTDAGSFGGTFDYGFTYSVVSGPVASGPHTVTLQCNQTSGDIHYIGTVVSAVGVSSN